MTALTIAEQLHAAAWRILNDGKRHSDAAIVWAIEQLNPLAEFNRLEQWRVEQWRASRVVRSGPKGRRGYAHRASPEAQGLQALHNVMAGWSRA